MVLVVLVLGLVSADVASSCIFLELDPVFRFLVPRPTVLLSPFPPRRMENEGEEEEEGQGKEEEEEDSKKEAKVDKDSRKID